MNTDESSASQPVANYDLHGVPYILLPYQQEFLSDRSQWRVVQKSRRIGITWVSACEAVLDAATKACDKGHDVWYMVNSEDDAREFIEDCAWWAERFQLAASHMNTELIDDTEDHGPSRSILAFRINFLSGNKIVALSSKAKRLRGKQGHAYLDEAAHHDDVPGFLKAAMAFMMQGGRVTLISTHNGEDSEFNDLVKAAKLGEKPISLHTFPFDRALDDGYYEHIVAPKLGVEQPDADDRAAYRAEVYEFYGEDADEELDCKPRGGGGKYLSRQTLDKAGIDVPQIHRIKRTDDYVRRSVESQLADLDQWAAPVLEALSGLDRDLTYVIGQDFGRKKDLTSIVVDQVGCDMKSRPVAVLELRNLPFHCQRYILWAVIRAIPKSMRGVMRLSRVAMDAAGNGQQLAEETQIEFGEKLVMALRAVGGPARPREKRTKDEHSLRYAEALPAFKKDLEDGRTFIPNDIHIMRDFAVFEEVNGIPTTVSSKTKDSSGDKRHGDTAVALLLAHYAACIAPLDMTIDIVPIKRNRDYDPTDDEDDIW